MHGTAFPSPPVRAAAARVGLAILVGFVLGDWLLRCATFIAWPGELIHPNGVCVYHAWNVAQGSPLYTDWQTPPHVATLYGPLFYIVPGLLGRGLAVDKFGMFIVGRGIALASTCLTGWLIFRILRRHRRTGWCIPAIAAGAFVGAGLNYPWGFAFRPDATVVCLSLLGVSWAHHYARHPGRLISLLPFLLAFLYKQSAILGPLAVCLHLLAAQRYRALGVYAMAAAGLFAGCVGLLNAATQGMYWHNCADALNAPLCGYNLLSVPKAVLLYHAPLLLIAAAAGVRSWWRGRLSLYQVAFAAAILVPSLAVLRVGSSINYYIEAFAYACVVAGRAYQGWDVRWRRRRCGATLASLALVYTLIHYTVWAVQLAGVLPANWSTFANRHAAGEQCRAALLATAERVDALAGGRDVLCQDSSLAIHLACPPVVLDTYIFSTLSRRGAFDGRRPSGPGSSEVSLARLC